MGGGKDGVAAVLSKMAGAGGLYTFGTTKVFLKDRLVREK
jgi:hypothetical protein